MKNNASRIFSVIYIACVISCVLLSSYLTAGVWARYFTQSEGSDSARVAKFNVSADSGEEVITLTLSEGDTTDTAVYSFSVTNNSEVAVSYDIILTLPEGLTLPSDITFSFNGIDNVTPEINGNVYYLESGATIPANAGEISCELSISASDFSNGTALNGIEVKIVISQVD